MNGASQDPEIYKRRGVSAGKADVKQALDGIDAGLFPGAFCKAVPDSLGGSPEHCLLLHADGTGSKAALAYLHYLRHGKADVFRGIAQDSLVMNLDDLGCVGAMGPFIYSNTIGRNAKRIPGEVVKAIIHGYEALAEKLRATGIELVSCGGETADLGDLVRTIVVDSSVAVRMRRDEFINCSEVKPGHVIVGLSSSGRASYEDAENSGVGTNGFTALRHSLLKPEYRERFPETFAPEIAEFAYTGSFDLDDPLEGTRMTIGEACLSPTRTYLPILREILKDGRRAISAIFHNTGGGLTKCLNFGRGVHYVKDNLFPLPPLFALAQRAASIPLRELVQVFNMGHRLEIVCESRASDALIAVARSFDVAAQVIGHVEDAKQNAVTIQTAGATLRF